MKKICGLVILTVLFGMLSACGGKEKQENAAETKNFENKAAEEAEEEAEAAEIEEQQTEENEEIFEWSTLPAAGEEDFEWKESEDGVFITGYLGSETAFKVPGTLDGKPVIGIGEGAFSESDKQKGLTSIDLTDTSLTYIQQQAFYQCSNLKRVALPDMSEYSIRTNPFLGCDSLSEVILGEGSELEMENGMIYADTTLIFRIPAFADTDVVIREGTTEIGHAAFYGNNVISVIMPDSVVSVDRLIFNECTELKSITLSSSLKFISQSMFERCQSLEEITLPEGIERMNGSAFMWCESLKNISIPSTLTEIGDYDFCRCEALVNISIPAGVTSIGQKAFSNCNSLTDVYYGGSEQDWNRAIGADAFESTENDTGVIDVTVHYND